MGFEIRDVRDTDATALVALVAAMGYTVGDDDIRQRLTAMPDDNGVFVADDGERILGWCHVFRSHSLIVGPRVEIAGLAVDEQHQRAGVGGALLRHAEQWALRHGVDLVYLRSGSEREAAHDFYRKNGYRAVKSQVAFSRTLRTAGDC
ncbi:MULTISPECIES: GNAT family N-acetyltransferase [Actinoplanes]|uniref:GNAT family N-acetyltransferase n=1 Tax=Actinoplanes TaxID=1865 RepID=UPI00069818F3|nr:MULTISPECIES: GNAT family N-acetyltransferase [Actinoplanes]GLY02954.1 hypothetical protein Acsp01_33330 [Actinoplanes sp. NBRC 101535]